jgi:hypothetical protein
MPSVVSTGAQLLCSGIGFQRLTGVERVHSISRPVQDSGLRLSVRPRKGHGMGHNRGTLDEYAGPAPSSASPDANPEQGGSAVGKVPVAGAGIALARNVNRAPAVLAVTGGAGAAGE